MRKSTVKKMPMDADLKEMIDALIEMEKYNDSFINSSSGTKLKQAVALAIYKAATDYGEAIRVLNTLHPFAKVSKVLLRSIFEALVTVCYNSIRDDDLYVLEGTKKVHEQAKANFERLEDYLNENNVSKIGRIHLSALRSRQTQREELVVSLEKRISEILKGVESDYTSKIHKQTRAVDASEPPSKLEDSLYFNYLQLYPYLSGAVHLGMDGVADWIESKGKQLLLNNTGESLEDVKRIIWQTLAMTKDIAVVTMKTFDKYDEDFDKKYQAIIDKHRP